MCFATVVLYCEAYMNLNHKEGFYESQVVMCTWLPLLMMFSLNMTTIITSQWTVKECTNLLHFWVNFTWTSLTMNMSKTVKLDVNGIKEIKKMFI